MVERIGDYSFSIFKLDESNHFSYNNNNKF